MPRFNLFTVSCAALLTLSACQTTRYQGNERSPFYQVPVGTRITLHQALNIPGDEVGVYLQGGRALEFSAVRKYYPHCKLELRTRREQPRTIQPDEFIVTRSGQEHSHSVGLENTQVVRAFIGMTIGDSYDGGPNLITFATRLRLHSEVQPEVSLLSCGHWAYEHEGTHVTIQEIRQTLGNILTLELPPAAK